MLSLDNLIVRLINLPHRNDRLKQCNDQFNKMGLKFELFEAISGNNGMPYNVGSIGEDGCLSSHFALIQYYYYNKPKCPILVTEDDIVFCDDFVERFKYIEKNFMYEDWDLFYLSSFYHEIDKIPRHWYIDSNNKPYYEYTPSFDGKTFYTNYKTSIKHIHRVNSAFTTVGYIINHKSIDKLYKIILNNLQTPMPQDIYKTRSIDHIYMMLLEEQKLVGYCFVPGMVKQCVSYSDITNTCRDQVEEFRVLCGNHLYHNTIENYNYDEEQNLHHDMWTFDEIFDRSRFFDINLQKKIYNKTYTMFYPEYFKDYFKNMYIFTNNTYNLKWHFISESPSFVEYINRFDKDSIYLDIGANCGTMAIPIALNGYKTISFEPVLNNISCLLKSAEFNKLTSDKYLCEKYAVSNETKTMTIHVPYYTDNASLHKESSTLNLDDNKSNPQICKSIKIDDWLEIHDEIDKSKINFIKIDVQGFELNVVEGMINYLKESKHEIHLIYETDEQMCNIANNNSICDINNLLEECGFIKYSIDDIDAYARYISQIGRYLCHNAIFVKNYKKKFVDMMDTVIVFNITETNEYKYELHTYIIDYILDMFNINIIVIDNNNKFNYNKHNIYCTTSDNYQSQLKELNIDYVMTLEYDILFPFENIYIAVNTLRYHDHLDCTFTGYEGNNERKIYHRFNINNVVNKGIYYCDFNDFKTYINSDRFDEEFKCNCDNYDKLCNLDGYEFQTHIFPQNKNYVVRYNNYDIDKPINDYTNGVIYSGLHGVFKLL
jgi:FkbM family methyltransferase